VSGRKGPFGWLTSTFPAPKPGGITWKIENLVTATHNWIFRKSGGRVLGNFDGAPLMILRTRGAKSGQLRESPVIYLADGDRMVVVASIGGNPRNPAWYHNMKVHPEIEVETKGNRRRMRAREASEAEADELWPRLLEMWPAWGDYMKRTDRRFPVMILEPLGV
jgi:F420H(2)-dependent quinone reductase